MKAIGPFLRDLIADSSNPEVREKFELEESDNRLSNAELLDTDTLKALRFLATKVTEPMVRAADPTLMEADISLRDFIGLRDPHGLCQWHFGYSTPK